jgi:hypothetical protein
MERFNGEREKRRRHRKRVHEGVIDEIGTRPHEGLVEAFLGISTLRGVFCAQ